MSEKERLWERHQERVKSLAERIKGERKTVRESVGPGGVRLDSQEVLGRYLERGVAGHLALAKDFQAKHPDWTSTDISKSHLAYDAAMWRKTKAMLEKGA